MQWEKGTLMKQYKEWKKRVISMGVALLMVVSTFQAHVNVFATEYAGVGTGGGTSTLPSGGSIAQVYTSAGNEQLSQVEFRVNPNGGVVRVREVSIYQNLTDTANPTSGVKRYTFQESDFVGGSSSIGGTGEVTLQVPSSEHICFATGETFSVVATLDYSNSSGLIFFYETPINVDSYSAFSKDSDGAGWMPRGDMIKATTIEGNIEDNTTIQIEPRGLILNLNETKSISTKIQPNYHRNIIYESTLSTIASVTPDGQVQGVASGSTTITATVDGGSTITDSIPVRVLEATLEYPGSTYQNNNFAPELIYTGNEIRPTVKVTESGILIPNTNFNISYQDCTASGTGKVVIDGLGNFAGYHCEKTFTIGRKEITQAIVEAGSFAIATDGAVTGNLVDGSNVLVQGVDYTATSSVVSTTAAGIEYEVTVEGKGNYFTNTPFPSKSVTVTAGSGNQLNIQDVIDASVTGVYTYTGMPQNPTIKIYNKGTNTEVSDFISSGKVIVSSENNINVGTAVVTLTGNETMGYTGTMRLTYKILQRNVQDKGNAIGQLSVSGIETSYIYDENGIYPVPVIRMKQSDTSYYTLQEGTDYTVQYGPNDSIGDQNGYVKINGKGNFKGKETYYFTIQGDFEKDINVTVGAYPNGVLASRTSNGVYASGYRTGYTGNPIEPEITVTMGEEEENLDLGTDYTVSYTENTDNTAAGKNKLITLHGAGIYAGKTVTVSYEITPIQLPGNLVIDSSFAPIYTGTPITCDSYVSIRKNGVDTGLILNQDYTIAYSQDNTNAGVVTVTATGVNNYTGTSTATFTIAKLVMSEANGFVIADIPSQKYTGSPIKPEVEVYHNGERLGEGDYTLSYGPNTNITSSGNKATVTVTGAGNYTGSMVKEFDITPKALDGLTITMGGEPVIAQNGVYQTTYTTIYDGAEKKPNIIIRDGNRTLNTFSDYYIIWTNNTNASTESVTAVAQIRGTNSYAGSVINIPFVIQQKDMSSIDIAVTNYPNASVANKYPVVNARDNGLRSGGSNLVMGRDYEMGEVPGESYTAGPDRKALVKGIGNYKGQVEITYELGNNLASQGLLKLKHEGVEYAAKTVGTETYYEISYLGSGVMPVVEAYYNNILLGETDVTMTRVSTNGTNIYTAENNNCVTVTVEGQGEYYGSLSLRYYIRPADIRESAFSLTDTNGFHFSYTGEMISALDGWNLKYQVTPSISFDLIRGTDYDAGPTKVGPENGTTTITVVGKGNYTGSFTKEVVVDKVDITPPTSSSIPDRFELIAPIQDQIYTGEAIEPTFSFRDKVTGIVLINGRDVDITYQNNVDIGVATIHLVGRGNYTGIRDLNFNIVQKDLSSSLTTVSRIPSKNYTGSEITVTTDDFVVTYDGTRLVKDVDYRIKANSFMANVYPGTASFEIEAVPGGTYKNSRTVTFDIIGDISDSSKIRVDNISEGVDWNVGDVSSKLQGIQLLYEGTTTQVDSNYYEVIATNYQNPGVATVTIRGKDKCIGTRTFHVDVIGNLSDPALKVENILTDYAYTGEKILPKNFVVTYGTQKMNPGVDYDITYGDDNKSAGSTGKIVITARPGSCYQGSITKTFQIKYDLNTAVVTNASTTTAYYTGNPITPGVTVKCADTVLQVGTDYLVSYVNNINAGVASINISPADTNRVMNSKVVNFSIQRVNLYHNNATVNVVDGDNLVYSGDMIQPSVIVECNGRTLVANVDYTLSYTNCVNAAEKTASTAPTVTIVGIGNYEGTVSKTYTIQKKDITSPVGINIVVSDMNYAGGEPIIPRVDITYNGDTLIQGRDYELTASNNTAVTTVSSPAHVKIKGIGNFKGELDRDFQINKTDLSSGGNIEITENSSVYSGAIITLESILQSMEVTCPVGDGDQNYRLTGAIAGQPGASTADFIISTDAVVMQNAGDYNIYITGQNNFYNTLRIVYTITPKPVTVGVDSTGAPLDSYEIELHDEDMLYQNGNLVEPTVVIKDKDLNYTLRENVDYQLVYENNRESASKTGANPPTVTIRGIGNYGEERPINFNIGTYIGDATITLSQQTFEYNGQEQKPSVEVVYTNGLTQQVLTEGIDYEIVLPTDSSGLTDMTNHGVKTIGIKGKGAYYGLVERNYTIHQKVVDPTELRVYLNAPCTWNEELKTYVCTYSGAPIEPTVTIYDDGISDVIPVDESNYQLSWTHNVDATTIDNPSHVLISLCGNYAPGADSIDVPFVINQKGIEDDFEIILTQNRFEYTGNEIIPEFVVRSTSGEELTEGIDYEVELKDNIKAGNATLTVTAKAGSNYSGSVSTNFVIYGVLKEEEIIVGTQFYTGKPIQPKIIVSCGGNELQPFTFDENGDVISGDYAVEYYSDDGYTNSGYVIVTTAIPGVYTSAYYSGTVTKTYQIAFDASLLRVTGYANEYTYTGKVIHPNFKVLTPSGEELGYLKDEVTYSTNAIDVGMVTATIPMNVGGQQVELTASYRIIPCAIASCDVRQMENNTYNGRAITPPVIILHDNQELKAGVDYKVTYSNNVNPGVADANVIGIGNFTGNITLHYNIISAAVINLVASPASEQAIRISWTRNAFVTGYEIYSADCRIRYGSTGGSEFTVKGLQAGTQYGFKVRSFVTAGGKTTYGQFKDVQSFTGLASTVVSVRSQAKGRVALSWNGSVDVAGYEIYRSESENGTYQKVAVMPKSAGGYTDSGLTSKKVYYYKVRTYKNMNGTYIYGPYSAAVAVTVK